MENKSKTTPIWKNNKGLIIAFSVLCVVLVAVPTILYLNREGPQGIHGLVGQTGPQGETGLTGPQGIHGLVGQTGPRGETGTTGPQGIHGLVGQTGPQGENGLVGQTGPQGENGLVGQQGIQGPSGGERGAKGDQGIQGGTGDTGATGIQGEQGEIDQGTMNKISIFISNSTSITQSTWYSQEMNVRLDSSEDKKAEIEALTRKFVVDNNITNYGELFTNIRLYNGNTKYIFVFNTSLLGKYVNIDASIAYSAFFVATADMLVGSTTTGVNSHHNRDYRASYYRPDAIEFRLNYDSITKSTWYSQVMNVRLDIEKKADIDELTKEFVDVHGITNYAELFTEIRLYTGLDEKLMHMPDAKLIFVFDTSLLEDYANIDKPIDSSIYDRFFVAKEDMLAEISSSGPNSNKIFVDDNYNPNASYRASYYKHDAIEYYGDKVVGDTSAWEE